MSNGGLPSVTNEATRMRKLFTDPSMTSYSAQLHDGISEFIDCEHCLHDANSTSCNQCARCSAIALSEKFDSIFNSESSPVDSAEELLSDVGLQKKPSRSAADAPVTRTHAKIFSISPSGTKQCFTAHEEPIRFVDSSSCESETACSFASSQTTVVEVHVSPSARSPVRIPNSHRSKSPSPSSSYGYQNCISPSRNKVGRSGSSEVSELTSSPSRSPALSPDGSLRRYKFPRDFSTESTVSSANIDEYKIPGDLLRRAWIQSSSQMRSPRFHVIFATAVAKSIFSQSELAASNVRGVGVDAPLDPGKMLAIHNAVAKYAGWKRRGDPHLVCQAKLREVDSAINNLCNDAKRCNSRSSNNPSPLP